MKFEEVIEEFKVKPDPEVKQTLCLMLHTGMGMINFITKSRHITN